MQSSEDLTEGKQSKAASMSADAHSTRHTHTEQKIPLTTSRDEEAIRQGLIYPPPPDFYMNMPAGPQPPPPAIPRSSSSAPTWSPGRDQQAQKVIPSSSERAPSEAQAIVDPIAQPRIYSPPPPYPAQPVYPFHTPVKHSYTWIWLLVSGLAILIFGSCILATWLAYAMFGSQINNQYSAENIGPQQISNYYGAIQDKNYAEAYSYLHPEGSIQNLTQAQFVQRAQDQDTQLGEVLSFHAGALDASDNGNTFKFFKESVDVGRAKSKNYAVKLTLQKIGSGWHITDFDSI